MHKDREALEAALARLARGHEVSNAIADPGLRSRLEPLLRAAATVHQLAQVQPSSQASLRIGTALRVAARRSAQDATPRLVSPRPAVALAIAVALATLGTTSVLASSQALPDSPLYPVRNLQEGVQVQLASNATQRATLYASFATARSGQLRHRAHNHERISPDGLATVLHDIRRLVHQANEEGHSGGPIAQSVVGRAKDQIGQQLNDVQQQGTLSEAENLSIGETIHAVQAEQQGQSSNNTDKGLGNTGNTGSATGDQN